MDAAQSKAAFEQAKLHFANDEFQQAYTILNGLNKAFPGDKNVLFPMARCLVKLNQPESAQKACDFLIQKFDHPGAKQLKQEIQNTADDMGDLQVNMLDFDLDAKPSRHAAPAPLQRASALSEYMPIIIWVSLFVVGFLVLWFARASTDEEVTQYLEYLSELESKGTEQTSEVVFESFPYGAVVKVLIAGVFFTYIMYCFASYLSLLTLGGLPNDDFGEDMKDVALYTLICCLLALIPILGWIACIVILSKHYEMSTGRTILLCMLWFVFALAISVPNNFVLNILVAA